MPTFAILVILSALLWASSVRPLRFEVEQDEMLDDLAKQPAKMQPALNASNDLHVPQSLEPKANAGKEQVRGCRKNYTQDTLEMTRAKEDSLEQARADDAFMAQMASLARGVYKFVTPIAGWELVEGWDYGADSCEKGKRKYHQEVAIYSRDGQCVLAFAGTDHVQDIIDDFKFQPVTWCGIKGVHKGWATRLGWPTDKEADTDPGFFGGAKFVEFNRYLKNPKFCGKGVIGVGHSMGGALAELAAACVNKKDNLIFKVRGLWTFGAAGIAHSKGGSKTEDVVGNAIAPDGVFEGARVVNFIGIKSGNWLKYHGMGQDLIATLGYTFGKYKHPKVAVWRLRKHPIKRQYYVDKIDYQPSKEVEKVPRSFDGIDNIFLHSMGMYIKRTIEICRESPHACVPHSRSVTESSVGPIVPPKKKRSRSPPGKRGPTKKRKN